jgi:hypothetical protein
MPGFSKIHPLKSRWRWILWASLLHFVAGVCVVFGGVAEGLLLTAAAPVPGELVELHWVDCLVMIVVLL